jgi:hypothetical protein
MSAVNSFYKDHGREPVALGDLVAQDRKGLATWQVTLTPMLIRVPLPSAVVRRALTRRIEIQLLTIDDASRPKIELLRASLATIV